MLLFIILRHCVRYLTTKLLHVGQTTVLATHFFRTLFHYISFCCCSCSTHFITAACFYYHKPRFWIGSCEIISHKFYVFSFIKWEETRHVFLQRLQVYGGFRISSFSFPSLFHINPFGISVQVSIPSIFHFWERWIFFHPSVSLQVEF